MSKKHLKLLGLLAVFVMVGTAWAATGITSATNFQEWAIGSGSATARSGFTVTGAGDFTFTAGTGLEFATFPLSAPAPVVGTHFMGVQTEATTTGFGTGAAWVNNLNHRMVGTTPAIGVAALPFPLAAQVIVPGTQVLTVDVRANSGILAEHAVAIGSTPMNLAPVAAVGSGRNTPVEKLGTGTLFIRGAHLVNATVPWVTPPGGGYSVDAITGAILGLAGANVNTLAGLRITAGAVRYGADNIVNADQAIRFDGPGAVLELNNHIQNISHIQSRHDGYGTVDFGTSGRGMLRVTNVSSRALVAQPAAGFLFDDNLYLQVSGAQVVNTVGGWANENGTVTAGVHATPITAGFGGSGTGDNTAVGFRGQFGPTATDGILYNVGGWRGTFAGVGTLELNEANPTSLTYTTNFLGGPVNLDTGAFRGARGNALSFPIVLRDANTVLTIRPNHHIDYFQDASEANVLSNNVLRTVHWTDANWTADRFNNGLLVLDSCDVLNQTFTHTMGGFVQNVRVRVAPGNVLRLTATTASGANPSAFNDNVFRHLEIAEGARFRLDDENLPNPNRVSNAGGFRMIDVPGGVSARRSVWARLDGLAGSGVIDLGATTPEVVLVSTPATLRATGMNTGNAIDFNFSGIVDNEIVGMGGIRVWGGRTVGLSNSANSFQGPMLLLGILDVHADYVTGELNHVIVGSGGGIRAVGGRHSINSALIFDRNSYIYTDVHNGQVTYLNVLGGISLAHTNVPGDRIALTAPAVDANRGDNIVVLRGQGVNTLVDRIVVTDNAGRPVHDMWEVRHTADHALVLHALRDIDADEINPNPPVNGDNGNGDNGNGDNGNGDNGNGDNGNGNGGSSGCNAGFAGLALFLAVPFFFRKRS